MTHGSGSESVIEYFIDLLDFDSIVIFDPRWDSFGSLYGFQIIFITTSNLKDTKLEFHIF